MSEKNMYKKVNTWFDIVKLEKNILKFWEKNQVFQKLVKKNQNQPKWSFLDGPITANNPMGVLMPGDGP
jgi:isoleucyl-tRNA synthetase